MPDAAPAPTVPHQVENAGRLLAQFSIITPELVTQILASPAHVAACNKFAHDLKTGKHAKAHSLSGLLLTILGIKKEAMGRCSTSLPKPADLGPPLLAKHPLPKPFFGGLRLGQHHRGLPGSGSRFCSSPSCSFWLSSSSSMRPMR